MATIDPAPTAPAAPADSGLVWFAADVPLNLIVRISGVGSFQVCGPVRGTELQPGVPFPVPEHIASTFLEDFGPRPGVAGVSPAAQVAGRTPGLRRVE